nr:hypothetical protein [uncultured Draconibacterium sp.]
MKKIGCLIVFTGIILAINSCNESVIEQDGLLKSSASYNEVIERAKIWFNDAPEENDFPVFTFTDEIKWNQAIVHDIDTAFMIEIPIKLKASNQLGIEGDKSLNIEQRLLIQQQNETFTSYIEFLISSNTKEELSNIKKVNIQYCKYNGADITILCINKKGKLTIRKQFKPTNTETSVELNLKSATYKCIGWFILYSDGSKDLIDILYCYETGGDNYNSSEPNGSAGSTPPVNTDNCNCNICQVCGGCTDLDLLKSFTDPGEYGEETINCPVCSCPVVDYDGLEQNVKAFCIYSKLMDDGILSSFIDRYFAPTEPQHSLLGELNLTWTIGSTIQTIPIDAPENNTYYSVEIRLSENMITSYSSTNVALTMLHEALHAKLMAEYYDETGSTDFRSLYQYYLGWGLGDIDKNQEMEMMTAYADQMAQALKDFDSSQGISHTIDFYEEVLKYTFSEELGLDLYLEGQAEYSILYYSKKTCQ